MAGLTLDWIQLASLLGAIQGLSLVGALVAQRHNRTANRLLAALVLAFTVYLASGVYFATGLFRRMPHLLGLAYHLPWVFGPVLYLYAVAASDRDWQLSPRDLWHGVPLIMTLVVATPVYLMSGAEKIRFAEHMAAGNAPLSIRIIDPFKYVLGLGYSVATVLFLRGHRRRVEHSYSNTARVNLTWLLQLAGAGAATWVLATMLELTTLGRGLRNDWVALAISAVVYTIGYKGLRQPEVFRYDTSEHLGAEFHPTAEPVAPPEHREAAARYERSGLGAKESTQLREALEAVMDRDQPWKDSDLTLADLAARVRTTPHKLSEVLNADVGQTFNDFVNGYRVREVQRRITAGEAHTLKILALAMDAGFASKSTFNQAFKKHAKQTPSAFREAQDG